MQAPPSELNPDDFELHEIPKLKRKTRKTRRRAGEFLRGPIPWLWVKAAADTRGPALFVALAIRHFCDLTKQRTIRIGLIDLGCGIVPRHAVSRALRFLESRGLIEVDRQAGRLLAITVLEIPA